jgi:hypothetical protein
VNKLGDELPVPKTPDGSWFPHRPLPSSQKGVRLPESEYPHTELGWRESKSGTSYPQAREFDGNGEIVRDIDFTDHNRPAIHPNPHFHPYEPNATGGSRTRSKTALPLF